MIKLDATNISTPVGFTGTAHPGPSTAFSCASHASQEPLTTQKTHGSSSQPDNTSNNPSSLKYWQDNGQYVFITPSNACAKGYYTTNAGETCLPNQPFDDPNAVLVREDDDQIKQFLDSNDAPQYRYSSDSELKREQQAGKEIASAFQKSQFGGGIKDNWEHIVQTNKR